MSIKRIPNNPGVLEPFYSFGQICDLLGVSRTVVARLFRKQAINLAEQDALRPMYRVPASVLAAVMRDRGYTNEQAAQILSRAPGNAA